MSSPAEILRKQVLLGGLSGPSDFPSFVSMMPDTPDEAMAFFDTAGEPDGRLMSTGERIEHPGVQIQLRSTLYSLAYNKLSTIAAYLDSVRESRIVIPIEGTYILHNVSRRGTIIPLGIEENDRKRRHYFALNVILTLTKLGP